MLAVILNQHLIKRRKQEEYKTAHSSPPDYETKNIVSSSDGVSCAEKDEEEIRICERYAFNNSALLMQPFTDGLRFAGRILIDAEEGADAKLPKNFILKGIWIAADLRKLNSIRIEDYENLKMISFIY